jgi:hypothetical protein
MALIFSACCVSLFLRDSRSFFSWFCAIDRGMVRVGLLCIFFFMETVERVI